MSWKIIRLGDYITTLTDYHANGAYSKLKANVTLKYEPDYAIMIRTLNFERNNFQNDLIYLNENEYNFLSKSKVYEGDIIMNKIANAGSVYYMPRLHKKTSLAMNLFLIRFGELNQKFMYYLMKINEPYIKTFANGTTTKSITKDAVRNLRFSIPQQKTQKRIADILSAYDDLIENNLKRIKLLEQAAQNIYKEWFVNMRFLGHENTPIDQETGLPEGWKECLLNEYIDFKEGPGLRNWQYRTEGIPFLNIRMMKSGDLNFSSVNFLEINEVEKKYNHFLLKEYDHIISTSGTLGKVVTIRKSHLPLCLNTSIIRLRPIRDEVGKWYIKRKVSCSNFLNEMKSFATGSAQLNFGPKHLNMMKIIVPSKFIGLEFEKLTNPIELKILSLLDYNQKLQKARDILLPRLMNQTIVV